MTEQEAIKHLAPRAAQAANLSGAQVAPIWTPLDVDAVMIVTKRAAQRQKRELAKWQDQWAPASG